MILYGKKYWGVPLLFRIYGSSLPRAQPFAWLALLECALVSHYFGE